MTKRESISRYILIINKLRKHPCSLKEISDYLALESKLQDYQFNISNRTFNRDLEDIRSLFNIDIRYNFYKKVYRIDDQQPEINERIFEAFDTFNALNLVDRLSNHIQLEKRRPQGTENLIGLLHAIKNRLQIAFIYHKFWEDEFTKRLVEPYALKEFKNRWYVLAKDLKDGQIKTFALDRLTGLDITRKHFLIPIEFNINDYFKYCFGIITPSTDEDPEEIILSFNTFQGKYIKSLPLHETQEILKDDEESLLVKLTLNITHDFIMELLSMGENVKVIQPKSLIEDIKKVYKDALENYR